MQNVSFDIDEVINSLDARSRDISAIGDLIQRSSADKRIGEMLGWTLSRSSCLIASAINNHDSFNAADVYHLEKAQEMVTSVFIVALKDSGIVPLRPLIESQMIALAEVVKIIQVDSLEASLCP